MVKRAYFGLIGLLAVLLAACGDPTATSAPVSSSTSAIPAPAATTQPAAKSGALQQVSIALDWTPNTNHTGLFVAQAQGWYKDQGIDLTILPYADGTSPEQLVTTGKADFAVSFEEAVVAGAVTGQPLVSVGAIIQHDTSVLATLKSSGLTRPRDLDGKKYAGFGTTYEEPTLQTMIKKDGGAGNFQNITTNVSGFQAVASKQADFVWIYQGWEAIQAKRAGVDLTLIPFTPYGIPDHYTPVIVTSPDAVKSKPDMIKRFMAATAKGYEYAISDPDKAADLLVQAAPKGSFEDTDLVKESAQYLAGKYKEGVAHWGMQASTAWSEYPRFLLNTGKLQDQNGKAVGQLPDLSAAWTNEFLPAK